MEKNEQSVDVDMLLEILLRLPAKYVGRFLCVSKFWATTIGSRDFVRSYSLREKQPPRLLLAFNTQVKGYQESWYFFSRSCVRDRAPDPVLRTPWSCRKAAEIRRRRAAKLGMKAEPPRAPEVPPDFVSSTVLEFKKQRYKQPCYAHGLMSFLYGDDQVICNPTTGKSLTLPPASVESTEMIVRSFLGYDPINAQYKVLCLTNVTRFCEHQVLTLGSANSNCSWRVIHCSSIVPHFPGTDSVCIGGVLYYTASPCLDMKEPFLVAFDLRSEALEIASMFPEDLESCNGTNLINYHGKVALVTQTNGGDVYHFYLWVFQDAQKWSKQHLTLRLGVSRSVDRRLEILGTSDLGEIVFAPIHFEDLVIVYYLDQKTNRVTTVFLKGNPNYKFRDFHQTAPCERRHIRTNEDDTETGEVSFSGQDDKSSNLDILEWSKSEKNGSLQILCEYYKLECPARGSTITFHPLDHLHPVEYHRPDEAVLHTPGVSADLSSCSTSLELAEAHTALMAEEEAAALSTWAVASLCGSLRLENVLMILAGALLEKQIVFVCSNLGILAASVLSIIPVIRPFRWQSLLMPVLPDDMLEFLDAPVPYIVGVKNKTSEVQSKLTNVIVVDLIKNQVKSPSVPQLPQYRDLYNALSPYHY